MNDIFRVRVGGGTPMIVSARSLHERVLLRAIAGRSARRVHGARQRRRTVVAQRPLPPRRVGTLAAAPTAATPSYEQLTKRGAKQLWPMWSADGKSLYFVSDRSGSQNIWILRCPHRRREAIRKASRRKRRSPGSPMAGSCGRRFPTTAERSCSSGISKCGRWTRRAATRSRCRSPNAERRPSPALEHVTLTNGFQDLALSPDGRKVAFVARGEVWAASARDGGDAVRVSRSGARESQIALAARQPPHRLRLGAERCRQPVPVRLHQQQRDAADEGLGERFGAERGA